MAEKIPVGKLRCEDRLSMRGDFPGELTDPKSGRQVLAKLQDMSHRGIGIVTPYILSLGQSVECKMGLKKFDLEVMWVRASGSQTEPYRYGLQSKCLNLSIRKCTKEMHAL